ncbi:MAG: nuclear transport factor 2 family protein [Acidobacteriota bacterium]
MILSKRITMVALIILLAVSSTLAHDPALHEQEEVAAVRKVLIDNARAFELGDLAKLEQLWANDKDVTVFEGGHVNKGWADYRDNHLKPELEELKNIKYTLSNIDAHVGSTTAWVRFEYSISGSTDKHGPFRGEGLGTVILEKREGKWRIVHWHSSNKPKK